MDTELDMIRTKLLGFELNGIAEGQKTALSDALAQLMKDAVEKRDVMAAKKVEGLQRRLDALTPGGPPGQQLALGDTMSPKGPLDFNTTFAHYTAGGILGQGGSGRVFRVTDEAGQVYALKVLRRGVGTEKRKRFKNELLFCQRNQHPNVITVVDHGLHLDEGEGCPFYVMPLCKGSLRGLMKVGIAAEKVLVYFGQVLDGVEAAHLKGIVHRDLKPENILHDAQHDRLVVADFGIARFGEEELYTAVETKANDRLANFVYAAPEQRSRGAPVDHRADIWALGLMLNEMYTGEVPWGTGYKTIAGVAPKYGWLDELVGAMLRQSPQERPKSIEVVKRELIGRQQEFITLQRVSELKEAVVPITEVDDPLVLDPPRLVGFDYDRGQLTLVLQQPVNERWVAVFRRAHPRYGLWGKGPDAFSIAGNEARIGADEQEVQQIINYFKEWLLRVNQVYEEEVRREKKEDEERERRKLQDDIEEREQRVRMLRNVKI